MMYCYMGNNKSADAWFDQTNDQVPFDAFGNKENQSRLGNEIFGRINKEIRIKRVKLMFIRIAAAVLLISSVGIAIATYMPVLATKESGYAWTEFSAGEGKLKRIILADSSVVILRPGAKLYAPVSFNKESRNVKLIQGEAYFEIYKDAAHPFIVQSGKISTKVLGTAFDINLRKNEIEVTVSHGKVQINDQSHLLTVLTKGKSISYQTETEKFMLDSINVAYIGAWTKTSVDLNNASLKELSAVFKSFYGRELTADSADLDNLRYTLTLDRETSAASTLKIITKIHGLYFKEKNGKIILYK